MSHFSVAVFSDGKKSLGELLAPFNENLEIESYIYKTKEELIEDAKEIKKRVMKTLKAGEDVRSFEACYINANTDEELYNCIYDDCYSYDEDGNLLRSYNPNSKWDWYSVGGRFAGKLKAKDGVHGEGSAFSPNPRIDGKYDCAFIKDIDFSPNMKHYDEAIRFWEVVVDESPLKEGESKEDFFTLYKKSYFLDYYKDKETYAKICANFTTYAVVTPDGNWYEKGEMGWFGASSETPDEALNWDLNYKERFIDTAKPDWILTIVDCHI